MKLKCLIFCCFWGHLAFANNPHLLDLTVSGEKNAPTFEPQELKFDQNKDYLLVIVNQHPFPIKFVYAGFGQNVATRFLQGTSSVSQESVELPANGKVTWHFIAQTAGEYPCYAVNSGLNINGPTGKIAIKALEPPAEPSNEPVKTALPPPKPTAPTAMNRKR